MRPPADHTPNKEHCQFFFFFIRKACLWVTLLTLLLFSHNSTADSRKLQHPAARADAMTDKKADVPLLEFNKPIEREIQSEHHSYQIKLEKEQFTSITVGQRGIDVVVQLFDPVGQKKAEVDSPNGAYGPERLFFIAGDSGSYRVDVKVLEADASVGRYRILVEELRTSTKRDRQIVLAQQLYAQGNALLAEETSDSLRTAIKKYEEALVIQQTVGDHRSEAATLNKMAEAWDSLAEKQKALGFLKQTLPLWQLIGDYNAEAVAFNNIAYSYDEMGEKKCALQYYSQALPLFRLSGDRREEATTLSNVGRVYAALSEYQKALDYYNQALSIDQSLKSKRAASSLLNIGTVYADLGEYQKALDYNNRALPDLRATKDRDGEGDALLNIGTVYIRLGKYRQAVDPYNQALQLFHNSGNRYKETQALSSLGKCYILLDKRKDALDYLTKALELARAVKYRWMEAYTLTNIGLIWEENGDRVKALDLYGQALPLLQAIGNRHGQAQALRNVGISYVSLGEKQKALDNLTQALTLNRELRERAEEGDTLGSLMFASATFGSPRLAIFYGKEAVNAFQEIRTNIKALDRELQAGFLKAREDIYRELANVLISLGRLSEAQQVLSMLKEEEYFDFIRRDGKESSALKRRADLTSGEAEWEKRYREIADQLVARGRERSELLAKRARTPEEEKRLVVLESDVRLAQEAFQKFLDQLYDEFGKSEMANQRINQLQESQGLMEDLRELGAGSVALYTLVGADKYRVILVTPDVQRAYEYPIKAEELNSKVAAFRDALENPDLDPLPLAQELYSIMIGPLAKDLKDAHAETLMWSLDGVLRYVPVAALHDGKRYMVELYRNEVFSLASIARLKDVPRVRWRALGLGVSKAHGDFTALPAVPGELHAIIQEARAKANIRGVLPGKVMLDEAFTQPSMKLALRQRYSVVHIASHFQFNPGNDTDSFLLLGDGDHLSVGEIKTSVNLFSGVELLTLSACDTATSGTKADGREVEGFGELAQRNGAKAVVASLWSVADQSTRLLMREFYRVRETHPGMSKAEALRQAQLSLLYGGTNGTTLPEKKRNLGLDSKGKTLKNPSPKGLQVNSKPPYSHPFFWAPFILIGNWK